LNPVPALAKWLVSYSYADDRLAASSPSNPKSVLTTRTNKILHEETDYVSGKKMNKWQEGQTFYIRNDARNSWGVYDGTYQHNNRTDDPALLPIPENSFRDLDWIKEENYAGSIASGQATFLVFVQGYAAFLNVNDKKALDAQHAIAYVDQAARLPVMVRVNGVTRTYSYPAPPSAPLTLPQDLTAELKRREEIKAKFSAAPQN
jgi:hypothetical protein